MTCWTSMEERFHFLGRKGSQDSHFSEVGNSRFCHLGGPRKEPLRVSVPWYAEHSEDKGYQGFRVGKLTFCQNEEEKMSRQEEFLSQKYGTEPHRNQFLDEWASEIHWNEVNTFISQKGFPSLPSFSGVNPEDWIDGCEEYFETYESLEVYKDSLVAGLLIGKAKSWYWSWSLGNKEADWDEFVEALCTRFENEEQIDESVAESYVFEDSVLKCKEVVNKDLEKTKLLVMDQEVRGLISDQNFSKFKGKNHMGVQVLDQNFSEFKGENQMGLEENSILESGFGDDKSLGLENFVTVEGMNTYTSPCNVVPGKIDDSDKSWSDSSSDVDDYSPEILVEFVKPMVFVISDSTNQLVVTADIIETTNKAVVECEDFLLDSGATQSFEDSCECEKHATVLGKELFLEAELVTTNEVMLLQGMAALDGDRAHCTVSMVEPCENGITQLQSHVDLTVKSPLQYVESLQTFMNVQGYVTFGKNCGYWNNNTRAVNVTELGAVVTSKGEQVNVELGKYNGWRLMFQAWDPGDIVTALEEAYWLKKDWDEISEIELTDCLVKISVQSNQLKLVGVLYTSQNMSSANTCRELLNLDKFLVRHVWKFKREIREAMKTKRNDLRKDNQEGCQLEELQQLESVLVLLHKSVATVNKEGIGLFKCHGRIYRGIIIALRFATLRLQGDKIHESAIKTNEQGIIFKCSSCNQCLGHYLILQVMLEFLQQLWYQRQLNDGVNMFQTLRVKFCGPGGCNEIVNLMVVLASDVTTIIDIDLCQELCDIGITRIGDGFFASIVDWLLLRDKVADSRGILSSLVINLNSKWKKTIIFSLQQLELSHNQSGPSRALMDRVDLLLENELFLNPLDKHKALQTVGNEDITSMSCCLNEAYAMLLKLSKLVFGTVSFACSDLNLADKVLFEYGSYHDHLVVMVLGRIDDLNIDILERLMASVMSKDEELQMLDFQGDVNKLAGIRFFIAEPSTDLQFLIAAALHLFTAAIVILDLQQKNLLLLVHGRNCSSWLTVESVSLGLLQQLGDYPGMQKCKLLQILETRASSIQELQNCYIHSFKR